MTINQWLKQPTSAIFNLALTSVLLPFWVLMMALPLVALGMMAGIVPVSVDAVLPGIPLLLASLLICGFTVPVMPKLMRAWRVNLADVKKFM